MMAWIPAKSDVLGPEYPNIESEIADVMYQNMYGVPSDDPEYDEMKDIRRERKEPF